jgi:hypothetical protein
VSTADAARMHRALENLRARTPLRQPFPATVFSRILIDRGNTLDDGSTLGVKYSSSEITSVPSAYDPTVTSSFIDGIGRGTLYRNGVSLGYVLVVNDNGHGNALAFALFAGDVIAVAAPTLIQVGSSDQYVRAYAPQFI